VEYARHVAGLGEARHAEYGGDPAAALIVPVACAVPGRAPGAPALSGALRVTLAPESLAARVLGTTEIVEEHFCNYELRRDAHERLAAAGLALTGFGPDGEARVVEIRGHPFYVATLFLPQRSSRPGAPHPLVVAWLRAAAAGRPVRDAG